MHNELEAYWGKARPPEGTDSFPYHLLAYHCLDVTAVANCWLQRDAALRSSFVRACGADENIVQAWILFYIALHDLGKWDVRFQLKARDVAMLLNPLFSEADESEAKGFDHGAAGFNWFIQEQPRYYLGDIDAENSRAWMRAVAAHHGSAPRAMKVDQLSADDAVKEFDRRARTLWVQALRELFLSPAGIKENEMPPPLPNLLSGFCCVCDWLGSNTDFFPYEQNRNSSLGDYFNSRQENASLALRESGLWQSAQSPGGMAQLFPDKPPRGVQELVEEWPLKPGLLVIEAPTGAGKTEAALAYASRLLSAGVAGSIIFALPTQATANAMLPRLCEVASRLFPQGSNIVLAHGKARFNADFKKLRFTVQRQEEASIQCAKWLSQSRKRAFLGQIGVCTIDQVLLSILPVRHQFVRGFGIRKSVLIVDEVHAYDSYMNGLLDRVLEEQRNAGGSAILLSATLPQKRHNELLNIWKMDTNRKEKTEPYPLVSYASSEAIGVWQPQRKMAGREIERQLIMADKMLPDVELLQEVCQAAKSGARVALICNLVADAQKVARQLRALTDLPVDLFHSRYCFFDRDQIERRVLTEYGKEAIRESGRILVSTQVVEQSLDLDFDWMITQLCPVDLLFQRIGRLHRHDLKRPGIYKEPRCAILLPIEEGYGAHSLIYSNWRVLWRTQQLLLTNAVIAFPAAYREWITRVYQEENWPEEPANITAAYEEYHQRELAVRDNALRLSFSDTGEFADSDSNVSTLTRDGEMGLNVIPVQLQGGEWYLLSGAKLSDLDEWQLDEMLNQQTIPVPHRWYRLLDAAEEGYHYLTMQSISDKQWYADNGRARFHYSFDYGLERIVK